ncbi:MFS general substrate transporter [Teratosphaeria nubilosa]|uniref:Probable transporter MCH1 n=1 Tax=Teratosphaeria nubilosa TaxID=161662 RepID=A0A6G1L3M1_9PEZI|nr:MFS general substrate transporter [Teratosphaeria nubilosa]
MSRSRQASSRRPDDEQGGPVIDKLDYHPGGRPLLSSPAAAAPRRTSPPRPSPDHERSYAGSFFEDVAEGIASQQRTRLNTEVVRYVAFIWALINALAAGSITVFSLYGPLFQKRLHYSQLQVNGVSITAELAMYLPVPLFGLLCDRTGPAMPSLLAGVFFGGGYLLAAFAYEDHLPYWVMVVSFVGVGCGTSCMYLSAVTTCAKNFGRGKYKGLALALPIACFGLSGMWQSQVGSQLLYETKPNGRKGDVDVYRFFLFLGFLLLGCGIIGFFALRIVGEEELIDEAVEEIEASGLLEDSALFQPRSNGQSYGTLPNDSERHLSAGDIDALHAKAAEHKAWMAEQERKKSWLLNAETRYFLSDPTMWLLTAGVFLVTGPGEAFINNLGTIIGTLYPPTTSAIGSPDGSLDDADGRNMTSPATHVSIVAITSTLARIITGTLTDLLAPSSPPGQHRRNPASMVASISSLERQSTQPLLPPLPSTRTEVSRIIFLLALALTMSAGQVLLATGALQNHGDYFWIISATMGTGYGAVFSLAPIIVSVVWGVENFGTNWGIVATTPAIGATVWGLVYSGVYQWAAGNTHEGGDVLCYGKMCYAPTFWAMAVSVWVACGLWIWAWRGRNGWRARNIAV